MLLLVLVLMMGVFVVGFEEFVILLLLLDLVKVFNLDVSVFVLFISIYGVMIFIGVLLLVFLGDKYFRELSLMVGFMIFIIGIVICVLV